MAVGRRRNNKTLTHLGGKAKMLYYKKQSHLPGFGNQLGKTREIEFSGSTKTSVLDMLSLGCL